MNELSLYILDIVQNSIKANSKNVKITVSENMLQNRLDIEIIDDGVGINQNDIFKVFDPFYTTRKTRDIGLGIPLFKELCELCNGSFYIMSTYKVGTTVKASMEYNHLDRPALGSIEETIFTLFTNDDDVDIEYIHNINKKQFKISSTEIKNILDGVSMKEYEVMMWIKEYISTGLKSIEEDI